MFNHHENSLRPELLVSKKNNEVCLQVRGDWTINSAHIIEQLVSENSISGHIGKKEPVCIDIGKINALDVSGAWLLFRTKSRLEKLGNMTRWYGMDRQNRLLIEEIESNSVSQSEIGQYHGSFRKFVDEVLVKGVASLGSDVLLLLNFLGEIVISIIRVILKPRKFRWYAFVHHLEYTGFRAVPIISLICFLIGAVIMQQSIVQLRNFGLESFSLKMMGVLALREVAVLLTAIMVAGRSGSAFTAEIGAMKMREEIDAMRTLGISEMETLVLPRLFALLVMLPLLTLIGGIMCLLGGSLMAYTYLGMTPTVYWDQMYEQIHINHYYAGLIKAPFAALAIALVGCMEGMKVRGSAESLGNHVTSAVVKAIFLVIILDAVFAMFFVAINF